MEPSSRPGHAVGAPGLSIHRLHRLDAAALSALSTILIDCVDAGASVGFMQPMSIEKAQRYWSSLADSVAGGARLLLLASVGERLVGTVQVLLAQPENQPHRGDLAKMLVHREARKQGVGAALLTAAEDAARAAGKRLLVLDTASAEAERLYVRNGWQRCGEIPDYAQWPDGAYCATIVYYKKL